MPLTTALLSKALKILVESFSIFSTFFPRLLPAAAVFRNTFRTESYSFTSTAAVMNTRNNADKKIFISYRVQDTSGETGRLVDALKQYFTDDQLFLDIETLEPGMDFTQGIEKSLSSCDVFLAVIGPNWAGPRTGSPSRLHDADDWVRAEVATALQRNIRVVPVLVDGGTLPKAEDLPDDLLPLLKRQTVEISNKRWRYDTDQLVRFLVNTVGIKPKKAVAQKAAQVPPKRSRTWLYVAGGFVLAILVFAVIGSQMEENKNDGTQQQTNAANLTQNTSPATNQASENGEALTTNNSPEEAISVSGVWDETDEAEASTIVLSQNGIHVEAQMQLNGQVIATGSGSINNHTLELQIPVMGVASTLRATLSDDGNTLNGTYVVPATGASEAVRLVRRAQ